MSVVEKVRYLTPDEYLKDEQHADVRHEYVAGQVYAMVGASRSHNRISRNLLTALHTRLRRGPCEAFGSDTKVRIADAFFYPDLVVTCDSSDNQDFYIERPVLVTEVLSPSTEARDMLDKRIAYQTLASLAEYLLIAQDKIELRVHRRIQDGWEMETCAQSDAARLVSVNLDIAVSDIYEGVPQSE